MTITEQEIFEQYRALEKTYEYFLVNTARIRNFIGHHKFKSVAYLGCGSSFCLCRGAEISARLRLGRRAVSLAAGDLLVNYPHYRYLLQDSLLIAPSRSGATSEVVRTVKKLKEDMGNPLISICAREKSDLGRLAELSLELPWIFDRSVCQTRSITNLYAANLMLIAIIAQDECLMGEIGEAIDKGKSFLARNKDALKRVGQKDWDKVVVLADSELEGIARAAALSFQEIAQAQANYYHVLDVRHGPVVLMDKKTLVVVAISPQESALQKDLLADLKKRKATIVTVSGKGGVKFSSDLNLAVPAFSNLPAMGIPFASACQALALFKARAKKINPDVPSGLDPWIILKEKR